MALNLVSLVQQFLTPQIVGSLARAVGINEAVAQRLVAAAIPTILASLATTAAAPGGAQKVADAVSNSDPDLLTKLASAVSGGNVSALSEGGSMLGGLLGGSGLVQPCRRSVSIFRSSASGDPAVPRNGRAIGRRHDRSARSVELVRCIVDRVAARQPEEPDLGGAASGAVEGSWRNRAARRPRRPCGRRDADGDFDRVERRERRDVRRDHRRPTCRSARLDLERLPHVGDHPPGRDRACGDLVVHEPESRSASRRRPECWRRLSNTRSKLCRAGRRKIGLGS